MLSSSFLRRNKRSTCSATTQEVVLSSPSLCLVLPSRSGLGKQSLHWPLPRLPKCGSRPRISPSSRHGSPLLSAREAQSSSARTSLPPPHLLPIPLLLPSNASPKRPESTLLKLPWPASLSTTIPLLLNPNQPNPKPNPKPKPQRLPQLPLPQPPLPPPQPSRIERPRWLRR